jgi:predicted secreted protein with PEFG-CTERM motif
LILIRTVQSDQNGNFTLSFKIPPTATSGDFSIIASARINGFVITQTKTMTATVPEFGSLATPIFGVSFLLIIGLYAFQGKFKRLSL